MNMDFFSPARAERRELITNIVVNMYKTEETLYAATMLLFIRGDKNRGDRFLFSNSELCSPFMHNINERFLKPQARALAPVLRNNAEIMTIADIQESEALPSTFILSNFVFGDHPSSNIQNMDFRFRVRTASHPDELILRTSESTGVFIAPLQRKAVVSAERTFPDTTCMSCMGKLLALFWTTDVRDTRICSPHTDVRRWWNDTEQEAARIAVKKTVLGIGDFLRSSPGRKTFTPTEYRYAIGEMVDALLAQDDPYPYDKQTHNFGIDIGRLHQALHNPKVQSTYAAMYARCRGSDPGAHGFNGLCPTFTYLLSVKTSPGASVSFIGMHSTLEVSGIKTYWDRNIFDLLDACEGNWMKTISLVQMFDHLDVADLRKKLEESKLLVRGAEMYYELLSSVQGLCTMSLLAAAV